MGDRFLQFFVYFTDDACRIFADAFVQGFDSLRIRSDFVDDQEWNLRVLGNDIEMRFNLSCEFFEESSRFFVDAEESTGENLDLFLENTDEQ